MSSSLISVGHSSPERATEEKEGEFRAMLKSLDSLLELKWLENAVTNSRSGQVEGRYAVMSKWGSSDPRWPLYSNGEIGEPFDILGWVSESVQDADSLPIDLDQAENKILKMLNSADNAKVPWKQRMAKAMETNRKIREGIRNMRGDMIEDEAAYQFNRAKGVPIVAVSRQIG